MVGAIAYENCHPFSLQDATGRTWTLIHNGTLFHAPQLNSYSARQRGETDSERALIRLVVKINEATRCYPTSAFRSSKDLSRPFRRGINSIS